MRSVIAVFLLLLCGSVMALEKGERLLPWTLLDQFDKAYTLDQQARILLVARNMTGAKLLNAALEGKPKGFLEARQAVFVADVSRMPAVISTLFAVPAMRDYQYRVLLDSQSRVASRYPAAEDQVLWLDLDRGVLRDSRTFSDAQALRQALEQAQ
ncbi:FAD/FMN-containing dehydrogenase [Pseudomonas sp. HAR-UPW-AIA-41]|uniref:FAD/FMN-containing dehydrogenase n=1 Tax=Pseudomonas sp. HAR-UPW-AIA-41 TaxID=1985301 RepID=UPI000BB32D8C|nr:FAD/FMN-containing dehydrogenase [Pseudomonas sp. HAR-UPW-AIA-41]PAV47639.1 FAD/FMN-containing dehydrogenase [Pseudomonas sp. HAR-UPW-AIA-41]